MNYSIITSSYFDVTAKELANKYPSFKEDLVNFGKTIDASRDLMKELRNALTEVKEAIDGKRKLQSADSLLDEL